MEEVDYYDEFGNYIGPVEDEQDEQLPQLDGHDEHEEYEDNGLYNENEMLDDTQLINRRNLTATTTTVVLHEDKKYFPSAEEVYGESVQVLVEDEDAQPLTEPIIAPIKEILVDTQEAKVPLMKYSIKYQLELLNNPEKCRNIAVVGHVHHGKTSLLDLLISHCHLEGNLQKTRTSIKSSYSREQLPRYLDSLKLEQDRAVSLRAKPISLLLTHSRTDTSYAVNLIDCPGHADFREEVGLSVSLLAESVLLVVDCVEGVQVETEATFKTAINLGRPVILVLTKLERLWLELKLPPLDSYFKLKHTVDRLNTLAGRCYFAPESGNVIFASALGGYAFSLQSFVHSKYPNVKDSQGFSRRLWGDCYFSEKTRKFTSDPQDSAPKRTFVTFILEPLYKIYTQVLSAVDSDSLQGFIDEQVKFKLDAKLLFKSNPRPLLKQVLEKFFVEEPVQGLIDALCCAQPSLLQATDDLCMSICKVYPPASLKSVGNSTNTAGIDQPRILCRLWSGTVKAGQKVRIHSGTTDLDDEEGHDAQIGNVYIPCTRYDIAVKNSTAAPWVLLTGISLDRIIKYGIITTGGRCTPPRGFISNTASHFRLSLEPLIPSELPKMLQVLRLLGLLYPSLLTQVEESGEHVLLAPGELYLDCVLQDLRTIGQVQIRLSDPSASLTETVSEQSTVKCFADLANGKLRITLIAEPMEKGLAELIESNCGTMPSESVLMEKYGWDRLSCRSVMSVSSRGGNVLLDDTFDESVEGLLPACRASILQGFLWACREGPLCEEPIRSVKFRLLSLVALGVDRGNLSISSLSPAQIVPATRRACYAAFLTASPRLLEPIQSVSILAPGDTTEVIYNLLGRRRGHILSDTPVAGTPLYCLQSLIPLLDSPGFETDLRSMTAGLAFPHATFSHWQAIPGDPLDKSIKPALLEAASPPALARDCLIKMRRRRGISEDVSLEKYFDPEILEILKQAMM